MRKALVIRRGTAWQIAAVAGLSPLFLASSAEAQTFGVSIGVRESGTTAPIGQNGGATGGIEWINLDGLSLTADGTWQQFTFNFGSDPVTAFAGATANGMLDGTRGALENIRIRNFAGTTNTIRMYIDDMVNTVAGTPTLVSGFEATDPIPATIGTEHMFQEPSFSGSTNTLLQPGSSALVSDVQAHSGTQSNEVIWAWNTTDPTSWLRLTTNNTINQGNPAIDFSAGNTLSFWLRAEQAAPTNQWTGATGGNWNDPANWTTGVPPNGPSGVANLLDPPAGPITINLDAPTTINTIKFNNAGGYTIAGTETLTLAGIAGFQRTFNVEVGSHSVTAPIEVTNGPANAANGWAVIVNRAQDVMTTSGSITLNNLGTLVINKQGAGRWDTSALVSISDPVTAPVSLQVSGGEARLIAGGGLTRVNGLSIAGGAVPTAKLNITNNPVVVDYVATDPPTTPLATIKAQVAAGYAAGSWNGNGIISTNANSSTHGVGYAEASTLPSVPAIFGSVDGDAILIRLTRYGDANLDGLVNLADFNRLAANFGTMDGEWSEGDFNYDNNVNLQDFNRLAANFGQAAAGTSVTPEDWANLASAIPEPTGASLLVAGALALGRRARRRSAV